MKAYLPNSSKRPEIQRLINEALDILNQVGIPFGDLTNRRLERIALGFLAVAKVTDRWADASDAAQLKTRDIIAFINQHFEEEISPGSYDDIRRKDLKLLTLAGLVLNSGDLSDSATNNPTRSFSLNPDFHHLIIHYGTPAWAEKLSAFTAAQVSLSERLHRKRALPHIPVTLPDGKALVLSPGKHNELQKAVIEQFLPRFGNGASVLYAGDAAHKLLHVDTETLNRLQFFQLSHDDLPDIIAYSYASNWLFLIEAVHSSGPMSEIRLLELQQQLTDCTADLIFVTAFLTRKDFRKWSAEIAWETEVWIAESPDHLIHFNGNKFLGPYRGA